MTVSVLFRRRFKRRSSGKFTELCKKAYKVTRAYDGCQGINLTFNVENNNIFCHDRNMGIKRTL